MDRIERLERSFMESSFNWGAIEPEHETVVPAPQLPTPSDEEARTLVMSAMCRSREFRWLVEYQFGADEARQRYPEAYLAA